jgi:predicted hydrocarbon binding protein
MDMAENSILSDLIYHDDEGSLRFSGVRYLLIRPETLASIQHALEAEVGLDRAGELLYAGGLTGGKLSGRKYKEVHNLSDREAVEYMCRMGGEIGWGGMELVHLDSEEHRLVVRVAHSPFAEAYGVGVEGVCHLIRGVFGGLVSGLFGVEVESREIQCTARGDEACIFEVQGLKQ